MSYECLDLRDLAKELEELREQKKGYEEDPEDWNPLDDSEQERLVALEALDEELRGLESAADVEPTLVRKYDWEDYCRELASDLGYMSGSSKRCDANPLLNYIDWERWASDCAMDYSEVEFDGVTYMRRD